MPNFSRGQCYHHVYFWLAISSPPLTTHTNNPEGTTGLPKGVLSTQRQFLTNVLNVSMKTSSFLLKYPYLLLKVLVGSIRSSLRNGLDIPSAPVGPQKGILVAVPLFHVTGTTSFSVSHRTPKSVNLLNAH